MMALVACFSGLLFGMGLMLSGLSNPAKVLGFLDLAGQWDPSLAFVMMGAIAVSAVAFILAKRRTTSLLGLSFHVSANTVISKRLVLGSAAFGIGWGLAGFCPGPALVAMGAGHAKAAGFVAAMTIGILVYEIVERLRLGQTPP